MDINPGFPFMLNGGALITAACVALLMASDKTGKPLSDVVGEGFEGGTLVREEGK
jgi:hypothetical protein